MVGTLRERLKSLVKRKPQAPAKETMSLRQTFKNIYKLDFAILTFCLETTEKRSKTAKILYNWFMLALVNRTISPANNKCVILVPSYKSPYHTESSSSPKESPVGPHNYKSIRKLYKETEIINNLFLILYFCR